MEQLSLASENKEPGSLEERPTRQLDTRGRTAGLLHDWFVHPNEWRECTIEHYPVLSDSLRTTLGLRRTQIISHDILRVKYLVSEHRPRNLWNSIVDDNDVLRTYHELCFPDIDTPPVLWNTADDRYCSEEEVIVYKIEVCVPIFDITMRNARLSYKEIGYMNRFFWLLDRTSSSSNVDRLIDRLEGVRRFLSVHLSIPEYLKYFSRLQRAVCLTCAHYFFRCICIPRTPNSITYPLLNLSGNHWMLAINRNVGFGDCDPRMDVMDSSRLTQAERNEFLDQCARYRCKLSGVATPEALAAFRDADNAQFRHDMYTVTQGRSVRMGANLNYPTCAADPIPMISRMSSFETLSEESFSPQIPGIRDFWHLSGPLPPPGTPDVGSVWNLGEALSDSSESFSNISDEEAVPLLNVTVSHSDEDSDDDWETISSDVERQLLRRSQEPSDSSEMDDVVSLLQSLSTVGALTTEVGEQPPPYDRLNQRVPRTPPPPYEELPLPEEFSTLHDFLPLSPHPSRFPAGMPNPFRFPSGPSGDRIPRPRTLPSRPRTRFFDLSSLSSQESGVYSYDEVDIYASDPGMLSSDDDDEWLQRYGQHLDSIPRVQVLDMKVEVPEILGLKLEDFGHRITNILSSMGVKVHSFQVIISSLCKIFVCAKSSFSPSVVMATLVDFLVSFGLSLDLVQRGVNNIKDHISSLCEWFNDSSPPVSHHRRSGRVNIQSVGDGLAGFFTQTFSESCLKYLTPLVSVLVTVLSLSFVKTLPGKGTVEECLQRVGLLGRAVIGTKALWEVLSSVCQKVFDFFYERIFGIPTSVAELEGLVEGVRQFYVEVQDLSTRDSKDKIDRDSDACEQVERVYMKSLQLSTKLEALKAPPAAYAAFKTHLDAISRLYTRVDTSGCFSSGPRTVPLVIHLWGTTGLGKSCILYPLCVDVLATEDIELARSYIDNIYMRNVIQDFWDGYTQQRITIYDDFGQLRDSVTSPNPEYLEVIKTGNIATMPLHMADICQKAKTKFTSRAIFLTSNAQAPPVVSLLSSDAFDRRIDIAAEVYVDPKYLKAVKVRGGRVVNVVDPSAVKKHLGVVYSLEIYTFKVEGFGSMDYETFSDFIREAYVAKYDGSKDFARFVDARVGYNAIRDAAPRVVTQVNTYMSFQSLNDSSEYDGSDTASVSDVLSPVDELANSSGVTYEDTYALVCDVVNSSASDECFASYIIEERDVTILKALFADFADEPADVAVGLIVGEYLLTSPSKAILRPSKLSARLAALAAKSKDVFVDWCSRLIDSITAHPFITFTGIVGTLLGALAMYWTVFGNPIKRFFKHCPRTAWVQSFLQTLKAETLCQPLESCTKRCSICDVPELSNSVADRSALVHSLLPLVYRDKDDARRGIQFVVDMGDGDLSAACESIPSGDNVTKQAARVKTESDEEPITTIEDLLCVSPEAVSGDSTTVKASVVKTEVLPCGVDPVPVEDSPSVSCSKDTITLGDGVTYYLPRVEAALDNNTQDFVSSKLYRNIYRLSTLVGEGWKHRLNGFMLVGRCFLVPAHILPFLKSSLKVKIQSVFLTRGLEFDFASCKVHPIKSATGEYKDAIILELPNHVPTHGRILHHFVNSSDISTFKKVKASIITTRTVSDSDGDRILPALIENLDPESRDDALQYHDDDHSLRYCVRGYYAYSANTLSGDCGSPLVLHAHALPRKLMGIHIAGAAGIGYAIAISREDLDRCLKGIHISAQILFDPTSSGLVNDSHVLWKPNGEFIPYGTTQGRVGQSLKSALRPSKISGEITEPTTAPSVLRPRIFNGVKLNPLLLGVTKAGGTSPYLDPEELAEIQADVRNELFPFPDNGRFRRELTLEEAIAGVPGEQYLAPINRLTSPGFPWILKTQGKPGKTKWLGEGDEYIVDDPEVVASVTQRLFEAKMGIRTPTLWIDTLKDERRPLAKVDPSLNPDGLISTRVFNNGPLDFTIAFRALTLGYCGYVMEHRIDNGIAVGINPYSFDWDRLARRAKSKGSALVAGDVAAFDKVMFAQVMQMVCEDINWWYGGSEEQSLARTVMFEDVIFSMHIIPSNVISDIQGCLVYEWTHAEPSGNTTTAVFNSHYGKYLSRIGVRICFKHSFNVWLNGVKTFPVRILSIFNEMNKMKKPRFPMRLFTKYIAECWYGDDQFFNIDDDFVSVVNQHTLTEAYAEIGITFTDEKKTGGDVPIARPMEEICFLKRAFRWDSERSLFVGPLALDTIFEMVNWVRGDIDQEASTITNVETAVKELSLHGPEVFASWADRFSDACRDRGIRKPYIMAYSEYVMDDLSERL